VTTHGTAWFERDHTKRVELLRQCCAEDIVFTDPTLGRLEGTQRHLLDDRRLHEQHVR
jgi:hypothetical protein